MSEVESSRFWGCHQTRKAPGGSSATCTPTHRHTHGPEAKPLSSKSLFPQDSFLHNLV